MVTKADTSSTATQTRQYYADFTTNLDPHPDKKDLLRNINEDAVITSIKNLLATARFERLNKPLIGASIRKYLFEPISELTEADLRGAILNAIHNYEPRANVQELLVTGDPDNNTYNITLTISVINRSDPINVQFLLQRVR